MNDRVDERVELVDPVEERHRNLNWRELAEAESVRQCGRIHEGKIIALHGIRAAAMHRLCGTLRHQ